VNEQPAPVPAIEELRGFRQWVVWRYETREGKETKVPYCPLNGLHAAVDDPRTWVDYVTAIAYAEGYDGIGFVVTAEDPFAGIDLDGCIDAQGGIAPWARRIVQEIDSYAEVTPSRSGLRVWLKGVLPPGRRVLPRTEGKIELYDRGRYFTVTGKALADLPVSIEERQEALERLHARLFPAEPALPAPVARRQPLSLSDQAILDAAARASNGADIMRLYGGVWRGDRYPSQSEADEALCWHLAFYSKDSVQLDRLFRSSGLFREKWDAKHYASGATYGEETVRKALAGVVEQYQPPLLRPPLPNGAAQATDLPQELASEEPEAVTVLRSAPVGDPVPMGPLPTPETEHEPGHGEPFDFSTVYNLAWLKAEPIPPPAYVVEDLIMEGCTLLNGPPKKGKTFVAHGIAMPVALGGRALGYFDCAQGEVLFIAVEDNMGRVKSRSAHLLSREEASDWPAGFWVDHDWGTPMNAYGMRKLEAWLKAREGRTRLVVLDPWHLLRVPYRRDLDITQEDHMQFRRLNRLGEKYHCGILILHHTNKHETGEGVNRGSGSHGQAAGAGCVLNFYRETGSHSGQLEIIGRDVRADLDGKRLHCEQDRETGFWTVRGDATEVMKTQERQQILAALANGPRHYREIADDLQKRAGTVHKIGQAMISEGILFNQGGVWSAVPQRLL
jgi:putative DNA primase/helicase